MFGLRQFHQRGCLLWKSFRLLRCLQKPETSLASQHVCGSTGCERYFNLYLLHAFFNCNSVPRQVDFGANFCRFHGFTIFTLSMTSLHIMGIIAVSRYFCNAKRETYGVLFNKRRILVYIAGVCCVALVGSVPPLFLAKGGYRLKPGQASCMYAFETSIAYTIFIECVYIGVPLSLITFCYIKVFYIVSRTNQVFSLENNPQQLRANVEEAKVTKTLAAVMAGFAFCWIPICVMNYIDAVRGERSLPREAYLTLLVLGFFEQYH